MQGEADVVDPGPGLQVARLEQCSPGHRPIPFLVLKLALDLAPDDALDDLGGRHLAQPLGEQPLSVAQDGDAVGNPVNLVHPVRDVDDRDSARFQSFDQLEQCLCLVFGEAGGWFVHDQHLGVLGQRLGDLGELPVRGAQAAQHRTRVDVDTHHLEDLGGSLAGFPVVDQSTTAQRLRGEVDVLRDGEGGDQAELLEDHADTGSPGTVDGGVGRGFAVYQNLALVGRVHPLKDLHQGRFPGAVAAGKGVYFTLGDFEADVAQNRGGVKGFVDAAHLDRQWGRAGFAGRPVTFVVSTM